jgi:hypothetical protein
MDTLTYILVALCLCETQWSEYIHHNYVRS